ncbi:hypothetical protein GCM10018987_30050 [Streptomyces cremeus]
MGREREGPPPCPPSPKLSASLEQGVPPSPPWGGPVAQGGSGTKGGCGAHGDGEGGAASREWQDGCDAVTHGRQDGRGGPQGGEVR